MTFESPEIVNLVYGIGLLAFLFFLIVAAVTTIARVAMYRVMGFRRPRLLKRDAILVTGFAITFGAIMVARVVNATGLRNNVAWALATTVPALIAIGTYVYYELFVIERSPSASRDEYLVPPAPPIDRPDGPDPDR